MEPIELLHELYRLEGPRLRDAWNLREERRKQREAADKASLPAPKDIILYHRKVKPSAARGGAK